MDEIKIMDAAAIRTARAQNPKMRERDLARVLRISEAALVAAHTGLWARRLRCDVETILTGLGAVGEVMALTRNESAVHEKVGIYGGVKLGAEAGLVLGEEIDLRVFPPKWKHAFAVMKTDENGAVRRSVQIFDAAGNAVHKVHLRGGSDLHAYEGLLDRLANNDQTPEFLPSIVSPPKPLGPPAGSKELHEAWRQLTDTHQFHGMLKRLNLPRLDALEMAHADFAWPLDLSGTGRLLEEAAVSGLPIMVFVGNSGCIQIHSGAVGAVKRLGPWINVMDETFHLHLRLDHITALWAVRKPTDAGHVTSIEAYAADRSLVIQFFGVREEGTDERPGWRRLAEDLTRAPRSSAA